MIKHKHFFLNSNLFRSVYFLFFVYALCFLSVNVQAVTVGHSQISTLNYDYEVVNFSDNYLSGYNFCLPNNQGDYKTYRINLSKIYNFTSPSIGTSISSNCQNYELEFWEHWPISGNEFSHLPLDNTYAYWFIPASGFLNQYLTLNDQLFINTSSYAYSTIRVNIYKKGNSEVCYFQSPSYYTNVSEINILISDCPFANTSSNTSTESHQNVFFNNLFNMSYSEKFGTLGLDTNDYSPTHWNAKTLGDGNIKQARYLNHYNPINSTLDTGNWTMNYSFKFIGSGGYQEVEAMGITNSTTGDRDNLNMIGAVAYSGSSNNVLAESYGVYGNTHICASPANTITIGDNISVYIEGNLTNVLKCKLYINNTLINQNDSLSVLPSKNISSFRYTGLFTESYINGRYININWTQFKFMSFSSYENPISKLQNVNNIQLDQNNTAWFRLSDYFSGDADIILNAYDPVSNVSINYTEGMFSSNGDYYDLYNYATFIYFGSYYKNYTGNFILYGCNTTVCYSSPFTLSVLSNYSLTPKLLNGILYKNLSSANYSVSLASIFADYDIINVVYTDTNGLNNLTCNYLSYSSNYNSSNVGNISVSLKCDKNLGSRTPSLDLNSNGDKNFNNIITIYAFKSSYNVSTYFTVLSGSAVGGAGGTSCISSSDCLVGYDCQSFQCTYTGTCSINTTRCGRTGIYALGGDNTGDVLFNCVSGSWVSQGRKVGYCNYTGQNEKIDFSDCLRNSTDIDCIEYFNGIDDMCAEYNTFSGFTCNLYKNLKAIAPNKSTITLRNKIIISFGLMIVLGIITAIFLSRSELGNRFLAPVLIIEQAFLLFYFTVSVGYLNWGVSISIIILIGIILFLGNKFGGGK